MHREAVRSDWLGEGTREKVRSGQTGGGSIRWAGAMDEPSLSSSEEEKARREISWRGENEAHKDTRIRLEKTS